MTAAVFGGREDSQHRTVHGCRTFFAHVRRHQREEMDASGLARMAKLRPQNEVGIELYRCEMGMFYIDSELKRRA